MQTTSHTYDDLMHMRWGDFQVLGQCMGLAMTEKEHVESMNKITEEDMEDFMPAYLRQKRVE